MTTFKDRVSARMGTCTRASTRPCTDSGTAVALASDQQRIVGVEGKVNVPFLVAFVLRRTNLWGGVTPLSKASQEMCRVRSTWSR